MVKLLDSETHVYIIGRNFDPPHKEEDLSWVFFLFTKLDHFKFPNDEHKQRLSGTRVLGLSTPILEDSKWAWHPILKWIEGSSGDLSCII